MGAVIDRLRLSRRRGSGLERAEVPTQARGGPPSETRDRRDRSDTEAEVVPSQPVAQVVPGLAPGPAEVGRLVPAISVRDQPLDYPLEIALHRLGLPHELVSVRMREPGSGLRLELVAGEVIGFQSESLVEIAFEIGGLLARDPVDEVHRDVVNMDITQMVDRSADIVRLGPALQHLEELRLEGLYAQRDPGDPVLGEKLGHLRVDGLWVRLDRHLARGRQSREQAPERRRLRERRCPTSEEDGVQRLREDALLELQLGSEGIDVARVLLRPTDQRHEVAVAAAMRAERQVDVQVANAPCHARHERPRSPFRLSTARNASCGISTVPTCFMRFFPFFCRSRSFRLRLMSPP
jgi:hypothetical protein